MRTGRPTAELRVTGEERATLERWARRPKSAQALAQRARIVLGCATGATNTDVAARFGVSKQPHLASLCAAAAPGGDVQAVQGPVPRSRLH